MDPFEHPWPSDLPPHCPHCKRPFLTSRHLAVGPGRIGRFFRACAYWGMVPWCFLGWILLASWFHAWSIAFFCMVPMALFMPFALISPDSRRVRCSHCNYDHDFPVFARKRRVASSHHRLPDSP